MPMEIVRQLPYNHPYRWDGTLFGGPRLWRPNELGSSLAMWLDAEDTASITLNGVNVSQWADKSGNGRNASQATASAQPAFATSQNLLQWSEQFNNAFWTKRGTATITANDTTAPDGTLTADRLSGLNTTTNDIFNSNYLSFIMGTPGASYTPSIYIKRISTTGTFSIGNTVNDNLYGRWTVDLAQLPDAWVRITATTTGVTVNNAFVFDPSGYGGILLRGVTGGALSMHIWGAQINRTSVLGTYQKTEGTAVTTINGKPSLVFDGNDLMSGTWAPATASQATVAVVCSYGVSTTTSAAASIGTNSANSGLGIGWNATFTRYNSFLWGVNEGFSSSAFTSNPVIQIGLLSSTEVAQSFNGVLNQAAIGSPATISTAYQVGAINGVLPLSEASLVAEVVILNVSASTDNRQRLEGYLAWKWGLEANLPSNHPYKLLPPTV